MTRGSAYKYLNQVYLSTKNDSYREALSLAISALRPVSRERSEEAWRGDWIAVRPEFAGHDHIGGYKCSRCKEEAVLDCNDEFALDNFCPRCGAAMTDEAVDMVMERINEIMEEMKYEH